MDTDDAQLLALTHRGNDAAARELWRRHAARLTHYARAIVGEHAAADVVQTVFVGLLRLSRAQIAAINDVGSYLIVAVRQTSISHERARRRQLNRERGTLAAARARARRADPEVIALDVHAMMDRLPRRLREVLVLKHHAGLTFDQMAIALGANRSTVATRYQDALQALRRRWTQESNVPPKDVPREMTEPMTARRAGGVR